MPQNIIRIIGGPPMTHLEERRALLEEVYGELVFHDFRPPYNRAEIFLSLQQKTKKLSAVAIELDSRDRHLVSLLAGGASECLTIPVIYLPSENTLGRPSRNAR